jgi:hypothetical protein
VNPAYSYSAVWQAGVDVSISLTEAAAGVPPSCNLWWEIVEAQPTAGPHGTRESAFPQGESIYNAWIEDPKYGESLETEGGNWHYVKNAHNRINIGLGSHVFPGDLITIELRALPFSALPGGFMGVLEGTFGITFRGLADFTVTNHTTREEATFQILSTAALYGYCAEWVVEHPTKPYTPPGILFANYGITYFQDAECELADGADSQLPPTTLSVSTDPQLLKSRFDVSTSPQTLITGSCSVNAAGEVIYPTFQGPCLSTVIPGGQIVSQPTLVGSILRCTVTHRPAT